MVYLMSVGDLNDRLDEAMSGPVAKLLGGLLLALITWLSLQTYSTVQTHSTLLTSVVSDQHYENHQIDDMNGDVKDERRELNEHTAAILVVKEKLDGLIDAQKATVPHIVDEEHFKQLEGRIDSLEHSRSK